MSLATDLFPFDDIVYRAFVPAVSHVWREAKQKPFDAGERDKSLATAMRYLRQSQTIDSWTPARGSGGHSVGTDPFEDG